MGVKIGHASIGSNGKTTGDAAGDQNGKEVVIRTWYKKPWTVLLRPKSAEVAERSAAVCEAGCANNHIGYNQSTRNTAHTEAKKVGYDLSKISTDCATDCSAFMTLCAIAGGVKGLEYTGNAPTTSTMVKAFTQTGMYEALTDSKYLDSDAYVKRGDILVKPGSHTVMVLENGASATKSMASTVVKATTPLSYPARGVDVSQYQKSVDYGRMKAAGVQFAIVKIINKSRAVEPMYETHLKGFQSVGVPVDVYNYGYATTVEGANAEALAVIKALNGRKCTVYYDVEDRCQQGLGERLIQMINAYQEKIEAAGCTFALYSGLSFVKSYLAPYLSKLRCKDIWMARYYKGNTTMTIDDVLDDTKKPVVSGFHLIGWQYTSSGRVDGYNGNLDLSVMYEAASNSGTAGGVLKVGYVTASSLRVRHTPSTTGKVLGYVNRGERVLIYAESGGWYRIAPNEEKWVSAEYVKIG